MTGQQSSPPAGRAASDLIAAAIVGVGIALSLSALMLVAKTEDVSELPMPLAVAFAAHLFGAGTLGMKALLPVGLALHVGYVTTATVIAVAVFGRRLRAVDAFGVALLLWVLAGVSVLPYVGWGLFGTGLGSGAAANVLAVHLLYGAFLWAGSWVATRAPAPSGTATAPATAPSRLTASSRLTAR